MSLILIRPKTPDTSRSGLVAIQYPINIGYLVSYLKENNIKCSAIDYEVEPFSINGFLVTIKKRKPSMIGFSCISPRY